MDIAPLVSQYNSALKTLEHCIVRCPHEIWDDPADGYATTWRVVYHTLFFTHFYLQKDHLSFNRWEHHRKDAQCLGILQWENNRSPDACEPYTRDELLQYTSLCRDLVEPCLQAMDLSSADSGFPWYKMGKFEHQLVNIRHIQHHAASLSTRLRSRAKIEIPWVGKA